jgi:hypothetical protein
MRNVLLIAVAITAAVSSSKAEDKVLKPDVTHGNARWVLTSPFLLSGGLGVEQPISEFNFAQVGENIVFTTRATPIELFEGITADRLSIIFTPKGEKPLVVVGSNKVVDGKLVIFEGKHVLWLTKPYEAKDKEGFFTITVKPPVTK